MSRIDIPIIVTRAEPGAAETVARLSARGLEAVTAPMLSLHELTGTDLPAASDLSGLIFTSANGVRTYAKRASERALPAWCVGPATATAARAAGFTDIRESAGNAKDLADFIGGHADPGDDPLLHVANAAAAGQLQQDLTNRGYRVAFAPLYEMRPAQNLPGAVARLTNIETPAILLLHSAKGAAATAALIGTPPDTWTMVAISEQAIAPIAAPQSDRVFLADMPNEDGLMAALDAAIATLSA
ncbi:MAG: uroporphyrinogen-III synthase [Henriciella sp.]|nr:uroporphyrinogen-III synthase [Henriciella sp.]